MAVYYHFDGWLVNIETEMPKRCIPLMKSFLTKLTARMKARGDKDGHPSDLCTRVIWYDSVTNDTGELCWQNELNKRNVEFYLSCDGIFLNYNWNKVNLAKSKEMQMKHCRSNDVFVGIDVFGRGVIGGGGFRCNVALKLIECFQLSVAIFAPGWTFEAHARDDFCVNELRFWTLLTPWLQCNEKLYCQFPIDTNFCQGYGKKFYQNGRALNKYSNWFCLFQQQLQCSLPCVTSPNSKELLETADCEDIQLFATKIPCMNHFEDAWNGCSSLLIRFDCCTTTVQVMRIHCLIAVNPCKPVIFNVRYIFKPAKESCCELSTLGNGCGVGMVPTIEYTENEVSRFTANSENQLEKFDSVSLVKSKQCPNGWILQEYCFKLDELTCPPIKTILFKSINFTLVQNSCGPDLGKSFYLGHLFMSCNYKATVAQC